MFIVGPPNPHPPNIPILHSFELTMQNSPPSLLVLKHCIICTFLIHSVSVQKMLTTLLKLV